jgi:hypothetical protein
MIAPALALFTSLDRDSQDWWFALHVMRVTSTEKENRVFLFQ